jgi:hypothetical protein
MSSLFPSNSPAKISIQSRTTVFASHTSTLREAICTSRHLYRHPCDGDTPGFSKRFVSLESPLFIHLNILRADIPCVLENDVGKTARSTQPVTLYVTVNITPPTLCSPTSIPTEDCGSPAEGAPIPGRTQPPSPEHPLPLSQALSYHQPVEAGNNKPQSREEVSPVGTKGLRLALDQADQAMNQIDRSNAWQGAVGRIKWVMDMLRPIVEVRGIPFDVLG